MMVVTHVAVGLLVATPIAVFTPDLAVPAAVGAISGGLAPDLDLFVGEHRRTLHVPVLGPLAAGPAALAFVLVPSPVTVAVAIGVLAAGIHSLSDVLGAGAELRPWERTTTDAVYDHVGGRWLRARYVIPYDGAPRDLLVAGVAAGPPLVVYTGPVRWVLGGLLVVGVGYTALRRQLVPYLERVA
ncbi:metal-dependent hydrolase [Halosegnis sp.]|uniref:metal-dependent hydrolase n=1 Tax=Halosegnis sp. TaxID=2864959 RepID=UPI0035D3F6C6